MSYYNNDIYEYLQKINSYIEYQNHKISQLEEQILFLQKEMEKIKNTPKTTIEKIEYKFDQLKVETLEGTLNIGISPNGNESIEDYAVNTRQSSESTINNELSNESMLQEIQMEINQFFENQFFPEIEQIEKKYHTQLGEDNHQLIIDDIKKQLDDRIQFYINQLPLAEKNQDSISQMKQVTEKVLNDIRIALDKYIENFSKKE